MATQHPEVSSWIVERLKPASRDRFLAVRYMTAVHAIRAFMYQDIYVCFVGGSADLHTRVIQMMYNVDWYMGYHGVPRMPVFIYHAINDELSDIRAVDELVERFGGLGANILYHRNTAGTHNQEPINGRHRAFAWLSSVLDGSYDQVYSNMGCIILNVTFNFAPVCWVGVEGNHLDRPAP